MSRWIDADELTKEPWFVEIHGETIDDIAEQIIKACKYIVKSAPSIDIVRCQDCKYWVYNFNGCSRNPCTEPWYATDFCNYGERESE